jgi:hypothetical protein
LKKIRGKKPKNLKMRFRGPKLKEMKNPKVYLGTKWKV